MEHYDKKPEWMRIYLQNNILLIDGTRAPSAIRNEMQKALDLGKNAIGYLHYWRWEDQEPEFYTDEEMIEEGLIND